MIKVKTEPWSTKRNVTDAHLFLLPVTLLGYKQYNGLTLYMSDYKSTGTCLLLLGLTFRSDVN